MKKILLSMVISGMFSIPAYASDYHVLTQSKNARRATVVFHIPVPDDTNGVGYSLRSAVSEYVGGTSFESKVPWLGGTETTDLQNGLLYEQAETVSFLHADNNAQKQTKIDNRFTVLTVNAVNKLKTILKFWHLNRDVP